MRVAIFTEVFLPKIDGITNRLRHTIRCLVEDGHTVRLFGPEAAVARYMGARVIRIPGVPFSAYPGIQWTLPHPRVLTALASFAPEVVHVVGPATMGVWGTLAARALGVPLVTSFHTDFPKYLADYGLGWGLGIVWPALRICHNAARINLCPSRHTAHDLIAHGIRDVGLWRGGVDAAQFHPGLRSQATRRRLAGGPPRGPIVLFVGRLGSEKNLQSLVHVFDRVPDAHLAFVGDGPGRAAIEASFAGRRAVFTGFLRG
ncbi:MAG: glycosyltransferase, partial [Myxococcales bacterium]|nr:glycosyltransferase [Myxococcales bacterium]